jgi:hypothetical protein
MNIIDTNTSPEYWHEVIYNLADKNDYIIYYSDDDSYIWFTTQYTQFLSRKVGETELAPIFGKHVKSLKSFHYQLNFSLPVGYRMKPSYHALYDLTLNFETEPERRFILWNDADSLLEKNKKAFKEIFETITIAAFLNRNGKSTIKENGESYQVDQRNFFFFHERVKTIVKNELLKAEYYIPDMDGAYSTVLSFNIFNLK